MIMKSYAQIWDLHNYVSYIIEKPNPVIAFVLI